MTQLLFHRIAFCLALVGSAGARPAHAQDANIMAIHPSWSPDGGKIAYYQREGSVSPLKVVDLTTGAVSTLTYGAYDANPSFSPGGSEIVFTRAAPDMRGQWDLALLKMETGEVVTLTDSPEREMHPQWSPDGEKISFLRFGDEGTDIYLMDVATKEIEKLTQSDAISEFHPKWRPDSGAIVFDQVIDGVAMIGQFDLQSGQSQILFQGEDGERVSAPSYARDSGAIIFTISGGERSGLWSMNLSDRRITLLTGYEGTNAGAAVYSPDGRLLAFHGADQENLRIYVANADGTEPRLQPIE